FDSGSMVWFSPSPEGVRTYSLRIRIKAMAVRSRTTMANTPTGLEVPPRTFPRTSDFLSPLPPPLCLTPDSFPGSLWGEENRLPEPAPKGPNGASGAGLRYINSVVSPISTAWVELASPAGDGD